MQKINRGKMSKEYEQVRDNFMREFGIVVTEEEFLKRGYLEYERLFHNIQKEMLNMSGIKGDSSPVPQDYGINFDSH